MKWIIYLLLLANISFFAWHYQAVGRDERRAQAEQQDRLDAAVRLVMLEEAESESVNEAGSESEPASKPRLPQCRSLGPFDKRSQAEQVNSYLQSQGIRLSLRVSNEARRKGYWVYLPPAASHAEARKMAKKLKKKHHIKDMFIVGTGEKKDGISLGVFSKFELAYRRQSEIRKLGFDAQLKDVTLPAKEYWLDWSAESVTKLSDPQMEAVREIDDSVGLVELDCHSEG